MCKETRFVGQYKKRIMQTSSLVVLVVMATACIRPVTMPNWPPLSQSESPLIPGETPFLVENRWRMVEVKDRGEIVDFATIAPIYIAFSNEGNVTLKSTHCNSGSFTIIAQSERHYYLTESVTTVMGCPEVQTMQYGRVFKALVATTEFELTGDQLILSGDETRIVLEVDNPQ